MAENNTRGRRAQIETRDVETAPNTTIDMHSEKTLEQIDRPDLDLVSVTGDLHSKENAEYLKDLKFMEDELTIVIGQTTDKNAENPVPCGVNGEVLRLYRGQEYKLKRKFVDSLIKVEDTVSTEQYKDKDNVDQTRVNRAPALKYPLSIINDPAGEIGRRWFAHQCKNAW